MGVYENVYEVEVLKEIADITDKWDSTKFAYFIADSLEEALAKSRKVYGDKVQSVEKARYTFHKD